MKRLFTLAFLLTVIFSSCVTDKQKATKAYEEGVALSEQANAAIEKGDIQNAENLYKQSLEKFKEAITLDSTHNQARSAMAHSYYGATLYNDAMAMYEQANQVEGEKAANYREMGLIKLQFGEITEGQQLFDKAIALDPTPEMISAITKNIVRIGERKFDEGTATKKAGNTEAGKKEQNYGMSVLMLAYYYDNSRKDVAEKIAKYADEIGDYTIKMQYTKLAQQ